MDTNGTFSIFQKCPQVLNKNKPELGSNNAFYPKTSLLLHPLTKLIVKYFIT
jgi:hypothetical protein